MSSVYGRGSVFSFYFELEEGAYEEEKKEIQTDVPDQKSSEEEKNEIEIDVPDQRFNHTDEFRVNISEESKLEGFPLLVKEGNSKHQAFDYFSGGCWSGNCTCP